MNKTYAGICTVGAERCLLPSSVPELGLRNKLTTSRLTGEKVYNFINFYYLHGGRKQIPKKAVDLRSLYPLKRGGVCTCAQAHP